MTNPGRRYHNRLAYRSGFPGGGMRTLSNSCDDGKKRAEWQNI